ncbi:hypothetical protein ACIQGT_14340 [Streptomyces sp. NPDC093108]|uniref:hypothetical protein n=1 Tax=unclassified Streptomyces TaxID=2593676 RepID=UPI003807611B
MTSPQYRGVSSHAKAAANALAVPGSWVPAGMYANSQTAKSVARHIQVGSPKFAAYQPPGEWDAYAAPARDFEAVWVRYTGGEAPLPGLPDRMTVRIPYADRATRTTGVITVTVAARCPVCGGPRGWNTVRPYTATTAEHTIVHDCWTNPCGHQDRYPDVLTESRTRRLPRPTSQRPAPGAACPNPPQELPQVALIRDAAHGRHGMHASQAAALLVEHGFTDDAALIRAEIKNQHGRMSAAQAATLLRDLYQSARLTTDYQTGAAS